MDTNAHHVLSFNHLLAVHIPAILATYGKVTVMVKAVRYLLQITDVETAPTRPTLAAPPG